VLCSLFDWFDRVEEEAVDEAGDLDDTPCSQSSMITCYICQVSLSVDIPTCANIRYEEYPHLTVDSSLRRMVRSSQAILTSLRVDLRPCRGPFFSVSIKRPFLLIKGMSTFEPCHLIMCLCAVGIDCTRGVSLWMIDR
jgi:hypothetical protein